MVAQPCERSSRGSSGEALAIWPGRGAVNALDPTRVSALGVIHPMRQKSTNARCVLARAALDAGGLDAFEERRDAVEEDSQGGPAGGGTPDLGGGARRGDGPLDAPVSGRQPIQ